MTNIKDIKQTLKTITDILMETKEKIAPETMLLHACTLLITKSLLDIIDIVEAKEQNSGRIEEMENDKS